MKRSILLAFLVLGGGVGLSLWRHQHRPQPIVQVPLPSRSSLILFADLREADSACGCGEVIRSVREAARNGWGLRELEPGSADPLVASFALKASPTVLLLSPEGQERARFEGEGPDTLKDLHARLKGTIR